MVNEKAETCWEYFDCPIEILMDCNVFLLQMGKECCYIGHLKKGCTFVKKMGIESCFECPWYKRNNPDSK